jgi:hypothetical protein
MTTRPMAERWRYPYKPEPRQVLAHQLVADEMLYGGAAGGGKSEFLLASAVTMALAVPGSRSLILRRTFPDLDRSLIPRLLARIPKSIATYHSTKHVWTFRNGSVIELGHLQRENDVLQYQGAEYQLVCFDELTQFTEFQYTYLISRLRAAGEVRERLAQLGLRPRMLACTNPGGPGHHWVRIRFIDDNPPMRVWRPSATLEDPRPGTRVFIPASLADNPHLDDSYLDRLGGLDEMLRRALRDGDWDILEGVRFTNWRRAIHVIEPETLPIPLGGVTRAVGVDYGLSAPFAALWGAKLTDGLVVIYRELYEAGLTPREQAKAIQDAERPGERAMNRRVPVALDPSTWARTAHTTKSVKPVDPDEPPPGSIAEAYRKRLGSAVRKANNDRLAGAALVDDKLKVRGDGLPRILVYSTCTNLIRTLPALPRANTNPEDVDTNAEDHSYDALRYLLMELEGRSPGQPKSEAGSALLGVPASETGSLATAGF